MFAPLYFALLDHVNATTSPAPRHNSKECSTAVPAAAAEQLGGAPHAQENQRLIEISTPQILRRPPR